MKFVSTTSITSTLSPEAILRASPPSDRALTHAWRRWWRRRRRWWWRRSFWQFLEGASSVVIRFPSPRSGRMFRCWCRAKRAAGSNDGGGGGSLPPSKREAIDFTRLFQVAVFRATWSLSVTHVTASFDTYRACMHNPTRCYVTKLSRAVAKSQLRSDDTRATDERAPPCEAPRRPSRLSTGRRRDTGAAPRPSGESSLPSLRRFWILARSSVISRARASARQ